MRALPVIALLLLATPASAQAPSYGQNPAQAFGQMKPEDAARLNQAVQSDPNARKALDQVQNTLTQAGHPAGTMLEKTRP